MATTFSLQHDFKDIPLSLFVRHLNDDKLNRMLQEGLGFDERKLESRHEDAQGISWQFIIKKCGELPKTLKKLVKDDTLMWRESSRLVFAENRLYWEITPVSKLLKFHGKGTFTFEKLGQGCRRITEGTISVELPLVGKMVEAFIVNELVKGYELEPAIQKQFYKTVA